MNWKFFAAAALAIAGAGCPPQVSGPGERPNVALQQKSNAGRRLRLGWVSWADNETLVGCNRRIDETGGPIGVLGPCGQTGPDNVRHGMVSWLNTESPDRSNADATPWEKCTFAVEEARLVPPAAPARLWLVAPSGRTLIEEWQPDQKVNGDAFSIEPSFSPDGKWLALVHVAVGLGEVERTVEIASVTLRAPPECK